MTYRERLKSEHGDYVHRKYAGGCRACPYMYGYEPKRPKNCNVRRKPEGKVMSCRECWGREAEGA